MGEKVCVRARLRGVWTLYVVVRGINRWKYIHAVRVEFNNKRYQSKKARPFDVRS